MRDEILTAAGIGTRQRHAECAAIVSSRIHFVANRIARPAIPVIARIAILNDEIRNYSVEPRAAIISRASERKKIVDGDRRVRAKQLERDIAARRTDRRVLAISGESGRT